MSTDNERTRKEAVTHQLIAEQAGVHPSTVSRILRRPPGARRSDFAAIETRVREAADRLGYRPNLAAASLRTNRSMVFGVLLPELHDVVLAPILSGADTAAFSMGYQTIVTNTFADEERRWQRVQMLLSRHVDGLIIGDATLDDRIYQELARSGTPHVLVNHKMAGHASVTGNDELGGRLVAEHLLAAGHRQVAIIAGPSYPVVNERVQGFVEVFAAHSSEIAPTSIAESTFDPRGGRLAAESLLALTPRPTAIFAVNDSAAIGAMGAMRDHGLSAGIDIAIVGYNDIPIARDLPVALSSVRTPLREMGEAAARLLGRMIEGEEPASESIDPTLIVRDSSTLRA